MLFCLYLVCCILKDNNYNTLQKKQNRNEIGILGDSSVFIFHMISSLAFGHTKSVFQVIFPNNQSLF